MQCPFIETLDDFPDHFHIRFVGKEHVTEAGDRIHYGPDPEFFGCQRTVYDAFDRKMMDKVRFFGFINGFDAADRFAFPDRVDPFAGKVEYDMTKTGSFQFFDVFSFR